jgi:asparagine synthase (glutamine-hydrolysing)
VSVSSRCLFLIQTVVYSGTGLGHVRLSIIDLETGKQPLSDEDGSIQCVVTGEIYDHARIRAELAAAGARFKTKSDSEVVLQLCVPYSYSQAIHIPDLSAQIQT